MILVAGSTGALGSEVVKLLCERGEAVRGLVRSTSAPEKVARLRALGAETVTGDLKDRASLDIACKGARTVISTVTIITTAHEGDSFEATDLQGNESLIDAAKSAGAEHFVFVSFDGSQFPDSPLTAAKREVEQHLKSSGLAYTILQPMLFMEIWLGPQLFGDLSTGQVKVYGSGNGRIPYVSSADVAQVAATAALTPSARNKTITFGGPDAPTQHDVVKVFEKAVGRPLTATEVPEQALEAQWKAAENPFEKTFSGLMLGVSRLDQDTVSNEHLPSRRTTVQEFARKRATESGDSAPVH